MLAPHIFVEDVSVASIDAGAHRLPRRPTCAQRLASYHDDPDSAFWGWNDIWLHPPFRALEHRGRDRRRSRCPVLAVQGVDDEYGTLEQIRGIAAPRAADADCSNCPTAGTRRIATSPQRLIARRPISFINTRRPHHGDQTIDDPAADRARRRLRSPRRHRARRSSGQAEGRPDAALHRHLRRARHRDRERLQAATSHEQGGKLGGREIEYVKVDDESDPSKATDNVNKLIKRDNVDVLVGTVHSGVAMAMAKVAKDSGTLLIVPNAGADAVTGPMCAPNIFRSSFSNWQPGYAMGEVAAKKGMKKVITITWKYAAGDESVEAASRKAFEKGGGKVVKELNRAVPERRVPGAADRDRGDQARRGLHLLRRRRRGQVRQGLRGGRPEEDASRCTAPAS